MSDEKKPPMRFTEDELTTIRKTFKDNQSLLKTVRKVMLQFPLNAMDLSLLEITFKNKAVQKVVRKIMLPTIDPEAPITQVIDFWMTVPMKDLMPHIAPFHLKAVKVWMDYTDQQLRVLEKGNYQDEQVIKFTDFTNLDKPEEEIYVNMLARNTVVNNTEQQLNGLLVLAGIKEKSEEEIKKDLEKSSNK